ncbi:expressed unknown protein [Seminavis robusta]|uniref:Uncharacterized protein n=1 Tax=Seminavis robusta TaxID=568900 RepID=A0A9N8H235_9STRA|nr:expressed unknown protein [Seminavis robusta]|eukprot:Sro56_g032640.1 n/a (1035) ;mRNA; f:20981-24085
MSFSSTDAASAINMRVLLVGPQRLTSLFLDVLAAQKLPAPSENGMVRKISFCRKKGSPSPLDTTDVAMQEQQNESDDDDEPSMSKQSGSAMSWFGLGRFLGAKSSPTSEPDRKKARMDPTSNQPPPATAPTSIHTSLVPSSLPKVTEERETSVGTLPCAVLRVETDEPLMRNGVSLVFEDISNLASSEDKNQYIANNWEGCSCFIGLVDAKDGHDHHVHAETFRFFQEQRQEKPDFPVILICDTDSADDGGHLKSLIQQKARFVGDVFGVDTLPNPGQLPRTAPVLITTSLVHVKSLRMASLMTLEDLSKPQSTPLVRRLGEKYLGLGKWSRMSKEQRIEEVHRMLHGSVTVKQREDYNTLLNELLSRLCNDDIVLKKMKQEVASMSFAPISLMRDMSSFKCQVEGLCLNSDTQNKFGGILKEECRRRFKQAFQLGMEEFCDTGKVSRLSALMESLKDYHEFCARQDGWNSECDAVKGAVNELLDGTLQVVVDPVKSGESDSLKVDLQDITSFLRVVQSSRGFRSSFAEKLQKLQDKKRRLEIRVGSSPQKCSGAPASTKWEWELCVRENFGHLAYLYCTFRCQSKWLDGYVPKKSGMIDMAAFLQTRVSKRSASVESSNTLTAQSDKGHEAGTDKPIDPETGSSGASKKRSREDPNKYETSPSETGARSNSPLADTKKAPGTQADATTRRRRKERGRSNEESEGTAKLAPTNHSPKPQSQDVHPSCAQAGFADATSSEARMHPSKIDETTEENNDIQATNSAEGTLGSERRQSGQSIEAAIDLTQDDEPGGCEDSQEKKHSTIVLHPVRTAVETKPTVEKRLTKWVPQALVDDEPPECVKMRDLTLTMKWLVCKDELKEQRECDQGRAAPAPAATSNLKYGEVEQGGVVFGCPHQCPYVKAPGKALMKLNCMDKFETVDTLITSTGVTCKVVKTDQTICNGNGQFAGLSQNASWMSYRRHFYYHGLQEFKAAVKTTLEGKKRYTPGQIEFVLDVAEDVRWADLPKDLRDVIMPKLLHISTKKEHQTVVKKKKL